MINDGLKMGAVSPKDQQQQPFVACWLDDKQKNDGLFK